MRLDISSCDIDNLKPITNVMADIKGILEHVIYFMVMQ